MSREGVFRSIDRIVIPVILIITWIIMWQTSEVHGFAAGVTFVAFLLVMLLYFTYRELRVHAAASRAAAVGEADELLEISERELRRRLTRRSKLPFRLYRSIALEMRGDRDAARAALDGLDHARGGQWAILYNAQRAGLAADAGEVGLARDILDSELRPAARQVRSAGAEVIVAETEARVLFAEGKRDEALAIFEKLGKDIRLGSATRALCRHYAGRILADRDPAASAAALGDAARLAPKTWMAR